MRSIRQSKVLPALAALLLPLGLAAALFFYTAHPTVAPLAATGEIQRLERQVGRLERDARQKKQSLARLKAQLLLANRFARSADHLVLPRLSRLSLADAAAPPGRRRVRYTPDTFNITTPSAVTAFELDAVLKNTALNGLGGAFVGAEQATGINALFLAGLAAHESDWGRAPLARDKNNLFGFGAYNRDPYHSAVSFPSKKACIFYVARFLRDHYIDGGYYRGPTIAAVNELYASDSRWSQKLFRTMLQIDRAIVKQDHNRPAE